MAFLQTLCSSSSGNCILVSGKKTELLVDCGMSARKISQALLALGRDVGSLRGVVVTHEHIDHVKGLAALVKKYRLPVYAHEITAGILEREHGICGITAFRDGESFYIEEIALTPFLIPHDTPVCVGYRLTFEDEQKILGVAADLGRVTGTVRSAMMGANAVYLESNHDLSMLMTGRYPYFLKKRIAGERGHLSNDDCSSFCAELLQEGTEHFVLGHLSAQNNLEELAFETTNQRLMNFCTPYELKISPKYEIGRAVNF